MNKMITISLLFGKKDMKKHIVIRAEETKYVTRVFYLENLITSDNDWTKYTYNKRFNKAKCLQVSKPFGKYNHPISDQTKDTAIYDCETGMMNNRDVKRRRLKFIAIPEYYTSDR